MSITKQMKPFTEQEVDKSPESQGVYCLYDGNSTPIYYGRSETSIRARLQRHFTGAEGPCTEGASDFNWELTNNPKSLEEKLMEEHKRAFGRLPKCNDVGA